MYDTRTRVSTTSKLLPTLVRRNLFYPRFSEVVAEVEARSPPRQTKEELRERPAGWKEPAAAE